MLIVLMLLAAMSVLMIANNRVLYTLQLELQGVDQEQRKKFVATPARTNATPVPDTLNLPPK